MDRQRLQELVREFPRLKVLVVGDFFLDQYLFIDGGKDEDSLETGLTAYQVVEERCRPGAAGTVVNNLCALGVGQVYCVGIIGDDGHGLALRRGLAQVGGDTSALITTAGRVTPTYTKPMYGEGGQYRELNRLDHKNWTETPPELEQQLMATLQERGPQVDAVIVADQVEETNCGVITESMRALLAELGAAEGFPPIFVDSRKYIGQFCHTFVKPNEREARAVVGLELDDHADVAKAFAARTKRPVFLTLGEQGQLVTDGQSVWPVPAYPVKGPVDIVGAGDSTMAGIVTSYCCGASLPEAAAVGNLTASITVQKIGTTGTATPKELLEAIGSDAK